MFGIKKLQKDIDEIRSLILQTKSMVFSTNQRQEDISKDIYQKLDAQKIELSKINTRFHDLGAKIDKTQTHIDKLAEYGIKMSLVDDKLMNKLVTDDAVLTHIKDFSNKVNKVLMHMEDLEKVMSNVDTIIDQCLPEKTIKLPKKKKATIEAS